MKNQKTCSDSPAIKIARFIPRQLVKAIAGSCLAVALTPAAVAQTYSLANVWQVANGTPSTHIAAGSGNRGMAYNAISNQVLVATTAKFIDVFDGTSGAFIGAIDAGWTAGGNAAIDQVGVGDDGAIYACSLQLTATNGVKIYRWQSWTDTNQVTAYFGNAAIGISGSPRLGDTMVVKGSGASTVIAMGVNNPNPGSSNIVLFSTTDGTNFAPTVVGIAGLPGGGSGVSWGLTFYTNNTLLVRPASGSSSGTLYEAQYPANFASLTNTNTVGTVIASTALNGGQWLQISYNDTAKLLAVHANAGTLVGLNVFPSFAAGASSVATATFSGPNTTVNGNETGIVALGGAGGTNYIYSLDTGSGLLASQIVFTPAAVPPTITVQPVGGTIYTNASVFNFNVSSSGSAPFTYRWQYNTVSNLATATDIPGATNGTYTLNFPTTSASGWYNVLISNAGGGPTSSVPVQLTVLQGLSSPVVTNVWSLAPGSRPYLGMGDYNTRGLAYDANTGTVLVSDHATTNIYVLNATNGNDLFAFTNLSTQGVTAGTFPLNLVGVADDGVIYFANLCIQPVDAAFFLYSYSAVVPDPAAALAYTGDPGNGSGANRWGDTMAVRGAGVNTQILLGSYTSGASVALLTTTDGANFTAQTLFPAGVTAGFASQGLCFGAGNTFWAKGVGSTQHLFQISFDPTGATAPTILHEYSTGMPADMTGLGVDAANNILAGVVFNDTPYDLQLFQLSGATNNPTLFHQTFFPQVNVNAQENAMTAVKFPRMFSLNANNGIVALTYNVPPNSLSPYSISAVARLSGNVVLTWQSVSGHSYQVQFTSLLVGGTNSWTDLGTPILAAGSSTSYTNTLPAANSRYYRIKGN